MTVELHHGDCLDVMADMADNSVDAIVTDPPYGLGFMGKAWDDLPPGLPWAQECLRVMKPGGHLLAFGGTRTWHRLAVAVEDAGFEIRDSVAWLYASGFPKSLDVSKAIDKGHGLTAVRAREFQQWLRQHVTPRQVNEATDTDMGHHWTTHPTQPGVATADLFDKLRHLLPEVPERIERLVAERTGISWEDYKSRPVVGRRTDGAGNGSVVGLGSARAMGTEYDHTAPATADAAAWAGWGTALKPAFEPIVVARKPLAAPGVNVLAHVESSLREQGVTGEIRWTSAPVSDAARLGQRQSSSSTAQQSVAGTSASPADAPATLNDEQPTDSDSATSTPSGATPTAITSAPTPDAKPQSCETKSSPPTATPAPAVTSAPASSSPSTTSTEAEPLTARRPGGRSTPRFGAKASLPVTESFAGTATGLTGSRATVRIDRLTDGAFVWPESLPRVVPGGPITVAANVLAWGTGALNIDGTRVEGGARPLIISKSENSTGILGNGLNGSSHGGSTTVGRWPTNVVLDDTVAAELDATGPHTKDGVASGRSRGFAVDGYVGGTGSSYNGEPQTYGGQGGPSRFFPTFRYQAKAPARERPSYVDDAGNKIAHSTVKPLDLMRWLVRLVTPPGGTVLDPFAGSGATVEACMLEGFGCVAIEREAEYLPLIRMRMERSA